MPQRCLRVLIIAGALLAAQVPASNASTSTEVLRLERLADAPIVLEGAGPRQARVTFELPPNARQGPDTWWKLRLRYRLRFSPRSGPGFVWVSSDTNDRTAASIEYTLRGRGRKLRARRTTVDVDGQKERRGLRHGDKVSFENYLQFAGVRGAANTWTFRLEQAAGARVDRLEILGATAILATRRSPYALNLGALLLDGPPVAGRPFRVLVRSRDRQGAIISDAEIRAQPQSPRVRLLGSKERRGGREFTFVAPGAARDAVQFIAARKDKYSSITLETNVTEPEAQGAGLLRWMIVLAPGLFAGLFWVLRSRRRAAP